MQPAPETAPPASAKPDPNRHDSKEAVVLAAARELFLELGYEGTSMDLVARRARASKTTLYSRFPSKEALFAAIISAACREGGFSFTPEEFDPLPLEAALCEIGQRFLTLVWSPEAARMEQILLAEAGRFPEVTRTYLAEGVERVRGGVAAYLAHTNRRGLTALPDPAFAAEMFLTTLKNLNQCDPPFTVPSHSSPEQRQAMIARTVDLFLNGARPR